MKTPILAFLCALSTAFLASGQVPSLINYQGRLTDANGAAVTGSKNFSIDIFDAATGGNLLYTETIGAVTLDSNGVYSFQFGSAGTSNKQVTETIGTTDGTTLVYSKALANSSVVNNSITVTDGTNSWSQSVGNPGVGATATANTIVGFVIGATITSGGSGYTSAPEVTISGNGTGAAATATLTDGVVTGINVTSAGSGYTTGATITIAPPVIPFRVEYSSGTITATYASAPTAGRTIAATYRYGTGGIADALGNAGEHWMTITVDGVTQGTRQRVLAVPFATFSKFADEATGPLNTRLKNHDLQTQSLNKLYNERFGVTYSTINSSTNFTNQIVGLIAIDPAQYYGTRTISFPNGKKIMFATSEGDGDFGEGWIRYTYLDGTQETKNRQGSTGWNVFLNPHSEKLVSTIESYELAKNWNGPNGNRSTLKAFSPDICNVTYNAGFSAKKIILSPLFSDLYAVENIALKVIYSDNSSIDIIPNVWYDIDEKKTISKISLNMNAVQGKQTLLNGIKITTF